VKRGEPLRFWVMLIRGRALFESIKAEPPCGKGQLTIPLGGYHLVIGWQR
jgi:hypothetical protein